MVWSSSSHLICLLHVNEWTMSMNRPESQLRMIGDAGHSGREDGIFSELINACEEFHHL
jgi:hypothetical protein